MITLPSNSSDIFKQKKTARKKVVTRTVKGEDDDDDFDIADDGKRRMMMMMRRRRRRSKHSRMMTKLPTKGVPRMMRMAANRRMRLLRMEMTLLMR